MNPGARRSSTLRWVVDAAHFDVRRRNNVSQKSERRSCLRRRGSSCSSNPLPRPKQPPRGSQRAQPSNTATPDRMTKATKLDARGITPFARGEREAELRGDVALRVESATRSPTTSRCFASAREQALCAQQFCARPRPPILARHQAFVDQAIASTPGRVLTFTQASPGRSRTPQRLLGVRKAGRFGQ